MRPIVDEACGVVLKRLVAGPTNRGHDVTPPPMSPPGSSAMATGLIILLLAASVGINSGSGGYLALLSFTAVLAGVSLIAAAVRMADDPTASRAAVSPGGGALLSLPRRDLAFMGLVLASSAVTAVAGEADPALCFAFSALLLLGISLITAAVRGG
ncbi:hypothetical protein ACP70R_002961 [Stipagrostis hirtigluma subsp. patula]